jgi:hypothetical protein
LFGWRIQIAIVVYLQSCHRGRWWHEFGQVPDQERCGELWLPRHQGALKQVEDLLEIVEQSIQFQQHLGPAETAMWQYQKPSEKYDRYFWRQLEILSKAEKCLAQDSNKDFLRLAVEGCGEDPLKNFSVRHFASGTGP